MKKCRCGCNKEAEYLMWGYDYDPNGINKRGRPFLNEGACRAAKEYCCECSAELGFPFISIKLGATDRQ